MDIFRTMIVTASDVLLARSVAASFGSGGEGMWVTPLSPTGVAPATHYISSGYIPGQFADLLSDPVALYEAVTENGLETTQDDIDALVADSDVTDEPPFTAMARLGLKMIVEQD